MNNRTAWPALLFLVVGLCACGSSTTTTVPDTQEDAVVADAITDGEKPDGAEADEVVDPTLVTLNISAQGGFDDWDSPGAALGYAVDEEQRLTLVVALKFNLPLASEDFEISPNVEATIAGYKVEPEAPLLVDDVGQFPILQAATTDTIGIRTMASPATVILLEGNPSAESPGRIFVARGGTVSLFRKDDGDVIEGWVEMTEVTALGAEGEIAADGEVLKLSPFYFEF